MPIKVISGPIVVGNIFRKAHSFTVPAGQYALVQSGPFQDGGYGLSAVSAKLFKSLGEAEKAKAQVERHRDQHARESFLALASPLMAFNRRRLDA